MLLRIRKFKPKAQNPSGSDLIWSDPTSSEQFQSELLGHRKVLDNNSKKRMKNGNNNTTSTTSNPSTATNDLIMAQTMRVALFGPFGVFFFFSSCFFFILNNIYSYYGYNKAMEGLREGGGDENRPKRRDTRHLGH